MRRGAEQERRAEGVGAACWHLERCRNRFLGSPLFILRQSRTLMHLWRLYMKCRASYLTIYWGSFMTIYIWFIVRCVGSCPRNFVFNVPNSLRKSAVLHAISYVIAAKIHPYCRGIVYVRKFQFVVNSTFIPAFWTHPTLRLRAKNYLIGVRMGIWVRNCTKSLKVSFVSEEGRGK